MMQHTYTHILINTSCGAHAAAAGPLEGCSGSRVQQDYETLIDIDKLASEAPAAEAEQTPLTQEKTNSATMTALTHARTHTRAHTCAFHTLTDDTHALADAAPHPITLHCPAQIATSMLTASLLWTVGRNPLRLIRAQAGVLFANQGLSQASGFR